MQSAVRRTLFFLLAVFAFLGAGSTLSAYPVKININVTFTSIAGQPDPLGLGTASPPITATISTTIESSTPMASYPATVYLTLPAVGLNNSPQTGTLSINTNGQITASFSAPGSGSFTATLALQGVTFPSPVPLAFGTANFSSPASSVNYNLLGEVGTVGVNGTITAVGLTASPSSISASYNPGGSPPAPQTITVSSNDPASPSVSFTAAVANATTPFLTLNPTSGTTPGSVVASFSTSVPQGTYTATVQVNTAGSSGAPISIPVTYTVGPAQTGPFLQASPSSLQFQFYLPTSTTTATQSVSITASAGSGSFTASVGTSTFLSVAPTSGSTPATLTVTANASGLSAGTHTGSLLLSSTSLGTLSIPVTVIVGQSGGGGGSSGPALTVLPSTLQFSYVTGQPAPASKTLTVSSPNPVAFTVSNVAFYLPVTPVSGTAPAIVTVGLNPSTLAPGNYTDNLLFRSATGATVTVPVTVSVISPGTTLLTVAPASLAFSSTGTGAAPTQTVSVTAAAPTGFTAVPSAPWLTVTPSNATTPGSLTVTANPAGLSSGNYSATITFTPLVSGASPQVIPVTFTIGGATTSNALPVAFAYQIGGPVPAVQSVTIPGITGSTVPPVVIGAPWLSILNTADLSSSTLTADATGLAAGVYNGAVKFVGPGTPAAATYVPVTLTVSSSPVIGFSPPSLVFNDPAAGPVPAVQELDVASTTGAAVTVTSDSTWLTAAPSSTLTLGTSQIFDVTATPGSLAPGVYPGKLTLASASATSTVPVVLNIAQTASPVINAVTNGISYANSIGAPGLIISVWGTGLAAPAGAGATTVSADGIPCPVLFASDGQINAVLPFSLSGQTTADIQVMVLGISSNIVSMAIQPVAPSLFTSNAQGDGGGAILNQDLSINSASNPAPAGTIVAIYGGGGGQTTPPGIDGVLTPVTPPFPAPAAPGTVQIAGQPAAVSYYGNAPGIVSGVLQINALIPAGTPSGPQPVVLSAGGIMSQPNVFVYVK